MMSERFSTTLRLCSTIRTVRFAATRLISAEMRSTSSWAIPAVGSSSNIISGSSASVVAISRARLRPYGSSTAGVCANAARPTASISSTARPFRPSSTRSDRQKSNEAPRLRWSATRTFSTTERWGNTAEIWNERTRPSRAMSAGREPVISRPLKRMRPRVGARKWVRRLKQVVLPAPLGPMSAWIVPRRTRSLTSFTATKPRNSLVSPSVSRMTSSAISGGQAGRRIEARLPLLLPRTVGLVHLPRRQALALRPQHLLEQPARVAVERLVEQPLGVGGRGGRGAARLADDGRERPVEVGARTHPVDETDSARLGGAHMVVQERQLLGAPHADDARQPQHRAVGDEAVARRAQAQDGVVGDQTEIARERQLQAAADRVAMQDGDRELRHVLQAVERAVPVPIERLADRPRRERGPVHARAERPAGPANDHLRDAGVGRGGRGVVGERGGELGGQRVEDVRPVERDPADSVPGFVGDERLGHLAPLGEIVDAAHEVVRSPRVV